MTFDVYFKASKTDSLADSIRLENVEIVKTNLNGSMIFFYNFDRQVIAQMHTDYICNIVPEAAVANHASSTKSPAEAVTKFAEAVESSGYQGYTEGSERVGGGGGSTGNYNQIPDGRNLKSDPVNW